MTNKVLPLINKLLFWLKFFLTLFFLTTLSFNIYSNNLMTTLLTSEFIIMVIFFLFIFNSIILNLNWILGFSFIIVILGGLEIALSFLLLNL